VFAAAIAATYPPYSSWADAINLTSHSTASVFGALSATTSAPADERLVFGDETKVSNSLGPVTLSGSAGDGVGVVSGSTSATITSAVGPSSIEVSGSTAADAQAGPLEDVSIVHDFSVLTHGSATLDATFTLTAPHLFNTVQTHSGFATAGLAEAAGGIFRTRFDLGDAAALTGTLLPGTYRLSVVLGSFAFADTLSPESESERSHLDLRFTLTPTAATPEPASLVLLGTGLVGAVARRATARRGGRPRRWSASR